MKMPIFKSLGTKDLEQFWFVADVVWKSQQITYDDLKKAQLVTALEDRALRRYIKYFSTHPAATLKDTNDALNNEFKKPKLQAHLVTEVKQNLAKGEWDYVGFRSKVEIFATGG